MSERERASEAQAKHDEIERCPICTKPFEATDMCAGDIELGLCHAECLDGSPVVDLDTGKPAAGPIDTFLYGYTLSAPVAAEPEPAKVKPLVWREPRAASNGCWTAESVLGTYSVVNEGGWYASRDDVPRDFYFEWHGQDMSADTLRTAQAAAQADYEQRIRSALESPISAYALAAARAEGRRAGHEDAARWHDEAERTCRERKLHPKADTHAAYAQNIRALAKTIGWCGFRTAAVEIKGDAAPAPSNAAIGAIENGREHMRRLVEHYDFKCALGPLRNCTDFVQAVRCLEHLADYAATTEGREG